MSPTVPFLGKWKDGGAGAGPPPTEFPPPVGAPPTGGTDTGGTPSGASPWTAAWPPPNSAAAWAAALWCLPLPWLPLVLASWARGAVTAAHLGPSLWSTPRALLVPGGA